MKDHPGRILQAMNRLQRVIYDEFEDLTPPDVLFAFELLCHEYRKEALRRFEQLAP